MMGAWHLPKVHVSGEQPDEKQLRSGADCKDSAMHDKEELYRATFERAPIGITHQSLEGEWLKCNDKTCQILGYSESELLGRSFRQLTAPGDVDESHCFRRRLLSGEIDTACFEKRYVRKDGTLVWAEITVTLQHDENATALRFIVLIADIHSRKIAEQNLIATQQTLRTSELRYRTIFETSADSICLIRFRDRKYVEVHAFVEITGYTRDEVIGRTSIEVGIWGNPEDHDVALQLLETQGEIRNQEFLFRNKEGGRLWGLTSATIVELDGEPHILAIARNITESKAAEAAIKNLVFYDSLTGLSNRRLLLERHPSGVPAGSARTDSHALLFIDLDNFKAINETLGHKVGDFCCAKWRGESNPAFARLTPQPVSAGMNLLWFLNRSPRIRQKPLPRLKVRHANFFRL
jgi:PAS domain S-box-containing protein